MTSIAKIESNRRNAARSTGPRTSAGKARSRQNAIRYGLSRPPVRTEEQTKRLKGLVAAIANGSANPSVIHLATDIAAATLEIELILAARMAVTEGIENPPTAPSSLDMEAAKTIRRKFQAEMLIRLERFERYLDRTMSRRRRALCDLRRIIPYDGWNSNPPPVAAGSEPETKPRTPPEVARGRSQGRADAICGAILDKRLGLYHGR